MRETEETTRGRSSIFRRLYGASPWHLAALLGCFALATYAVTRILDDPALWRIALWFVGAALVWDLVVGPLIALCDRVLRSTVHRALSERSYGDEELDAVAYPPPRPPVRVINYVRAPLLLSGLLLMVWAPVILQRSEETLQRKAGLSTDVFLERWIAISLALCALSSLAYALACWREVRRG